jgi:3-oxoacyl-[acyl-carrier-protein] synthase-3
MHKDVVVVGSGAYLGSTLLSTTDIAKRLGLERDWIWLRSGIESRNIASAEEGVEEMGFAAANQAIEDSGLAKEKIDGILVATISNLKQSPSLACKLAKKLKLRADIISFDINAACAGFSYAFSIARSLIMTHNIDNILIVASEKMTDIIGQDDKENAFLFADGAGAVVLSGSEETHLLGTIMSSDCIHCDDVRQESSWREAVESGVNARLELNGLSVYRWTVEIMPKRILKLLASCGVSIEDVAFYIPHQANLRIIESIVKKLGLSDKTIVAKDIVAHGNTSAASIPIALNSLLKSNRIKRGDIVIMSGFGAGIVYGVHIIKW